MATSGTSSATCSPTSAPTLSFVVIATMWRYHHVFCRELDRINARLTTLNLLYLGLIALIPFPTGLIAERGDESAAVIVYAVTIALVTGMAAAMNLYAQRAGLTARRGRLIAHYLVVPGVFIASIPIAAIDAEAGMYSWLALPVLIHLINRRQRRRGGLRWGRRGAQGRGHRRGLRRAPGRAAPGPRARRVDAGRPAQFPSLSAAHLPGGDRFAQRG